MYSVTHDELNLVNTNVNKIPYKSEYGDDWTPITDEGDCDSFATEKYRRLVELGWPKSALRLATCWTERGEYHAVLLADLEGTTYVLDNRHPWPMEHTLLPYKWHKYQIAGTQDWEFAS